LLAASWVRFTNSTGWAVVAVNGPEYRVVEVRHHRRTRDAFDIPSATLIDEMRLL